MLYTQHSTHTHGHFAYAELAAVAGFGYLAQYTIKFIKIELFLYTSSN